MSLAKTLLYLESGLLISKRTDIDTSQNKNEYKEPSDEAKDIGHNEDKYRKLNRGYGERLESRRVGGVYRNNIG